MNRPPFHPSIALIVGVISVSTAAVLVKLANSTPASIIANYRLLIAVAIMTPYVFIKYRSEFKLISRNDWVLSIFAGIFLAFHFILWFESLNYTSVASSVVLVTLQPIFGFIGTYIFFRERFAAGAIVSMIIAITGSIIIAWGDFQISGMALFGDILALLGAVMITAYFLFGQHARKRLSLMTYTFVVYSISTITLFIYNLVLGYSFLGYPSQDWWIFLALAIIPTFFGHTLFNWALRWLSTSVISMSILFEPVGASILAYYIVGEKISLTQWIGGMVVIFGLFLFIISTNKNLKLSLPRKESG